MNRWLVILTITFSLTTAVSARSSAAGKWPWPLTGSVTAKYNYSEKTPFRPGQRRGIKIAAAEGQTVTSSCSGTVKYAGEINGTKIVSVSCAGLRVSYLPLGSLRVSVGMPVKEGQKLATTSTNYLRFGVRREDNKFAYLDPLTLLTDHGQWPPALPGGRIASGRNLKVGTAPVAVAQGAPAATLSHVISADVHGEASAAPQRDAVGLLQIPVFQVGCGLFVLVLLGGIYRFLARVVRARASDEVSKERKEIRLLKPVRQKF